MPSPNDRPDITVITVVKNGEDFLRQAIASILSQACKVKEILVVDGQSSDGTAAIARSFPQVRYLLQTDEGIAKARNLGLHRTASEWVAFLDHDDQWSPDKLRIQLDFMHSQPELQYTTTLMQIERDGQTGPARPGCTPGSMLARRTVFQQVGLFDTRFHLGCDADWFTRARDLGVPTAVVPHVLLYKRLHATNASRAGGLNRLEMLRIAKESIARRR
jgi:glycosyltransferase involved in cell wall biosynthesis